MENQIHCMINREIVETSLSPGMCTLDFIRQHMKLPGTKEGCREGECGACTVLLGEMKDNRMEYKSVASCLLPLGEVQGKHVVTVEGINTDNADKQRELTPVQQVLVDEGASQCGFCTPGIVMALTGFFLNCNEKGVEDAIDALDGNICRCTGYAPIARAARKLVDTFLAPLQSGEKVCIPQLVEWNILPHYFLDIPEKLARLKKAKAPETAIPEGNVLVAGATDLLVQQGETLTEKALTFVSYMEHMRDIQIGEDTVSLGAAVTVEEMKNHEGLKQLFPDMKEYLNLVSSTIMRNRATLAGNIVNASPIGDMSIMLLALQAVLTLSKDGQKRQVSLKDFYKGYKQMDLAEGEMIETIVFPVPAEGTRFHFEKVSQRRYLDIASCNCAISVQVKDAMVQDIHLSAGGVAPIPLYLAGTCNFLNGKAMSATVLKEAAEIIKSEIAPISDVRGTAQYKTLLLRNLFFAHFMKVFPDLPLQDILQEVAS